LKEKHMEDLTDYGVIDNPLMPAITPAKSDATAPQETATAIDDDREELTPAMLEAIEAYENDEDAVPIVLPNRAGARSVELAYPPVVNGKRLTKIRMRMPLQEDLDAWAAGDIQTIRQFISRLTDLHPEILAKLSWPDSDALHSVFEGITPDYLLRAKVE
jgi:hypothetical protein